MTFKAWLARVARFRLFGLRADPPASTYSQHASARGSLRHRLSSHMLDDVGLGEL